MGRGSLGGEPSAVGSRSRPELRNQVARSSRCHVPELDGSRSFPDAVVLTSRGQPPAVRLQPTENTAPCAPSD